MQRRSQFLLSELHLLLKDADNVVKRSCAVEAQFEKAKESLRLMGVSAEKVRRRGVTMRGVESGMEEEGSVVNDEEEEVVVVSVAAMKAQKKKAST